MANTVQRTQQINAMAQALVASDPVLRTQLAAVVQGSIYHMRFILKHGSPADKMIILKNIMPHLLNGAQGVDQAEAKKQEAAAYERMLAMMRGEEPPPAELAS